MGSVEVYSSTGLYFKRNIRHYSLGERFDLTLIPGGAQFFDTMGQKRDAPTAEEVAEAAGGDVETARRALSAVRIRDETAE